VDQVEVGEDDSCCLGALHVIARGVASWDWYSVAVEFCITQDL